MKINEDLTNRVPEIAHNKIYNNVSSTLNQTEVSKTRGQAG